MELDEQEKVKQSITAEEAFKKWVEGHRVYFIDVSDHRTYIDQYSFKARERNITRNDVFFSKWYIEGEE